MEGEAARGAGTGRVETGRTTGTAGHQEGPALWENPPGPSAPPPGLRAELSSCIPGSIAPPVAPFQPP